MFDTTVSTRTESERCSLHTCAPDGDSVTLSELLGTLGESETARLRLNGIRFPVRRLKPRQLLHRAGDRFDCISVVRSGALKSACVDAGGIEQVVSFPMQGDVIGLEGVGQGRFTADVVALEVSHVAVVPFARLAQLGRDHYELERLIYKLFSRELMRDHDMVCLLSNLTADARVATFLLELSDRYRMLGCSASDIVLRMRRQDVASYLGIQLETVSRTLSAFAAAQLIEVHGRNIVLRDPAQLRRIANGQEPNEATAPRKSRGHRGAPKRARQPSAAADGKEPAFAGMTKR